MSGVPASLVVGEFAIGVDATDERMGYLENRRCPPARSGDVLVTRLLARGGALSQMIGHMQRKWRGGQGGDLLGLEAR